MQLTNGELASGEDGDSRLVCIVCGEEFDEVSELLKHQNRRRHAQKIATCWVCGKRFHKSANLKRHEALHADGKLKPRQLGRRNRLVKNSSVLKQTHTCKVCHKSFNSLYSCQKHEQLHAAELNMLSLSLRIEHIFVLSDL